MIEQRNKRLVHENKILRAKLEDLSKEIRVLKKINADFCNIFFYLSYNHYN